MAMTLRLTPEQDAALTLLAETQGVSKQEAAVRAILDRAARTVRTAELREMARLEISDYRRAESRIRRGR